MIKSALTRLAKGSLVYGIGGMLQRFMGLLLLPFYTRALTPEDYGIVALISLIVIAMSGLLTLGTGNSMGVLYYREFDVSRRSTIIWSNVALLSLNALIWYSILYLTAPSLSKLMFQSNEYAYFIRLALLGSVFTIITDPWLAYLRMEEKARLYVIITLVSSILTISLSIWFVLIQGIGVLGIILAGTLAQCIMMLINYLLIGRQLSFQIDPSFFRPLVRIGFPSIFGLFAFLLIDYADRQMIERILSLNALGIYSIGYSFGMVMTIGVGAFATAWAPFFMSYLNKQDEASVVFSRVLTYYTIGFGVLIVFFFFLAKPLVLVMTISTFHEAHLVIGLVAAAYMLKGYYLIFLPGIYFAEKLYMQSAIEWVGAIINISLNLWFIPLYGIVGAALATFFSYLSLPILTWLVARRYLNVEYDLKRITRTSMAVIVASGIIYILSKEVNAGLLFTIIINAIVFVFFSSFSYKYLFSIQERNQIWRKLSS